MFIYTCNVYFIEYKDFYYHDIHILIFVNYSRSNEDFDFFAKPGLLLSLTKYRVSIPYKILYLLLAHLYWV